MAAIQESRLKVVKTAQPGLPPQNLEAEEAILCAILIDNEVLLDVVEILKPEDFYKTAHQKIYSGILELFSENEPIDLVTLANELKKNGVSEETGGAAYLASLVDSVPMSTNAVNHARIISDKACLRRLIEKSNAITRKCYEEGTVDDTIDFAEGAIFEISENKIRPSFSPISDIVGDNMDTLEKRAGERTLVTGITTGFSDLDNLTSGLQPSDLIILAARPSMGKTAFALNIARNAAVKNHPVALFSLEMSKEQLSMRMLCAEARVDSFKLRGGFLDQGHWENLTNAASALTEMPIFIDDSPAISAMEIRSKTRRLMMEKGLSLIVIDYLQLMKPHTNVDRRDLEISDMSRSLKILAKELSVPVMALSQLNRKLEERSDKRPQLSDLRESGALEQDADVVAFIYRDEVYNKDENNPNRGTAEIIVAKQRNGPIGDVKLKYLNTYTRFENLAVQNV